MSTSPHELAEVPAADAVLLVDQQIQEELSERFSSGQLTAAEYQGLQQSLRTWQALSQLLTAPDPSRVRTGTGPEGRIEAMTSELSQFSSDAILALRWYKKHGPEIAKELRILAEHQEDLAEAASLFKELRAHLAEKRGVVIPGPGDITKRATEW